MDFKDKRILIVDDEERLLKLLATFFASKGAQVECAGDGEQALKAVTMDFPDLVIMDLNMPGVNGQEAIRSMRMINTEKPILVLSGYCARENFQEAISLGATECLAKPVCLAELQEVAERLMASGE